VPSALFRPLPSPKGPEGREASWPLGSSSRGPLPLAPPAIPPAQGKRTRAGQVPQDRAERGGEQATPPSPSPCSLCSPALSVLRPECLSPSPVLLRCGPLPSPSPARPPAPRGAAAAAASRGCDLASTQGSSLGSFPGAEEQQGRGGGSTSGRGTRHQGSSGRRTGHPGSTAASRCLLRWPWCPCGDPGAAALSKGGTWHQFAGRAGSEGTDL